VTSLSGVAGFDSRWELNRTTETRTPRHRSSCSGSQIGAKIRNVKRADGKKFPIKLN